MSQKLIESEDNQSVDIDYSKVVDLASNFMVV